MTAPVALAEDLLRCARLARLAYERDPGRLSAGLALLGYPALRALGDAATGTDAYLAWNGESVVFAARGTTDLADVRTDLKFRRRDLAAAGKGCVHRGFLAAWRSIADDVLPLLEEKFREGLRGEAVGHSLGGALAVVAAAESGQVETVTTFGCPRVGDAAFARRCRAAFAHRRVVRGADAVPLLPLLALGFRHDRASVYVDGEGDLRSGTTLAAEAWGRVKTLFTLDWTRAPAGLGFGPLGVMPARMASDHSMAGYEAALAAIAAPAFPPAPGTECPGGSARGFGGQGGAS
jgi:hypothetical protein